MKDFNLNLEVGDNIIILHMEGESGIRLGTPGVVMGITNDPFEDDNKFVQVMWDNGSTLSLMTKYDKWKKVGSKKINEGRPEKFYKENKELFENFDHKFFREYLLKIRESGIINMFGAAPLLYGGAEHIDRYYGENPPNEDAFQDVLDMANESKDKMIQGVVKYLKSKNKEIELEQVQRLLQKFATKIVVFYIEFS